MLNRCQIDPWGGEGEADSRVGSGGPVPNKPLTILVHRDRGIPCDLRLRSAIPGRPLPAIPVFAGPGCDHQAQNCVLSFNACHPRFAGDDRWRSAICDPRCTKSGIQLRRTFRHTHPLQGADGTPRKGTSIGQRQERRKRKKLFKKKPGQNTKK